VVEGRPQHDDFTGGIRLSAEKVYDLPAARHKFARGIKLFCNGQSSGTKLREMLAAHRNGPCPVSIIYTNRDAECRIDLGEEWRVKLNDTLLQTLTDWLQPENVQIQY
jgi:DNA polymerase-3 subunit alpha